MLLYAMTDPKTPDDHGRAPVVTAPSGAIVARRPRCFPRIRKLSNTRGGDTLNHTLVFTSLFPTVEMCFRNCVQVFLTKMRCSRILRILFGSTTLLYKIMNEKIELDSRREEKK